MQTQAPLSPSEATDRYGIYRFFDGMSVEGKTGLNRGRNYTPLVKTFLLEHVGPHSAQHLKTPEQIFTRLGAKLTHIDETFYSVASMEPVQGTDKQELRTVGFVEEYDSRFFAYYTCEDSTKARSRVQKWTLSPDLDSTWFSSPLLQVLWDKDVSRRGDARYGKLVFKHESIFEMPDDASEQSAPESDEGEAEVEVEAEEDAGTERPEENTLRETRKARFEMADRIGRINESLSKLQGNYSPLNALYALRMPSLATHGSHDLFQQGQITNRSDSFLDHRNTVRYLYRIYNSVLTNTEERAWHDIDKKGGGQRLGGNGVPLIVNFEEPLSEATFNRWVSLAFNKRNRFRLWGDPIRLGPKKVHVYGADRHLWQPINMELTSKGLVALLPQGTCGNTFHRLVANIQHYLSPKIDAWVGSTRFKDLIVDLPSRTETGVEDAA